jgi:predicted DNA-binding transcriptional regulator AlpA
MAASRLPSPLERVYRKTDLPLFFGVQRTTIEKWIKEDKFPRGLAINDAGNARAWTEKELLAFQKKWLAERRAHARLLAEQRRIASMPPVPALEDDAT